MRTAASLSPAEQSSDEAGGRSPDAIAELQGQMKLYAGDPKRLAPLQAELAAAQGPQGASANDPGFASALTWNAPSGAGKPTVAPVSRETKGPGKLSARVAAEIEPGSPAGEVALRAATQIGAPIVAGWRGLAHLATGGTLAEAADLVNEETAKRTYQPTGRAAEGISEALESPYSPLTWFGRAANWLGGKSVDTLARAGASPEVAAGAGALLEGGLNAAPLAFLRGGKRAPIVIEQPAAAPAAPVAVAAPGVNLDIPAVWRKQALQRAAQEAQPVPAAAVAAPAEVSPPASPAPLAAGLTERVSSVPPAAVGTVEIPVGRAAAASERMGLNDRVSSAPPDPIAPVEIPKFAEAAPAPADGMALPKAEAVRRAEVLRRIGLTEARQSAVSGDPKSAATDFQQSRLDNPGGNYLRAALDQERQALARHAETLVQETGGTLGTDSSALYGRGNTILAPLDSLKGWFDAETRRLYGAATERAKGVPVDLPSLQKTLAGDRADFLGTVEGEQLLKGLNARMKSLGMTDAEGKPAAVTVEQAERLKQYLGEQWQPRTSRLIRGLKNSIDDDVLSAAGEDIYKQARAVRHMRAVTLDDPKGIAKLMDAEGPDGINRAVAVEKIPDTVTALPVDQLEHIIQTLKSVPKEMQPQAGAALAEIKAQFANRILDAGASRVGQWGVRDVTKYLNNNREKLARVFSKEELAKITDLNDAGNILAKDQSYPGAAVQEHNLMQRGAMAGLRAAAAGTGGFIAGPVGAAVGNLVGEAAASKLGAQQSLKSAQKRVVKLSDFPQ